MPPPPEAHPATPTAPGPRAGAGAVTYAEELARRFTQDGFIRFYSAHADCVVAFVRDKRVKVAGGGVRGVPVFTYDDLRELAPLHPPLAPAEVRTLVEAKRQFPNSRLLNPRALALPGMKESNSVS